jgi:hypothetical protein
MRLLVTIPHYYRPDSGSYGSGADDPSARINGLEQTITALYENFSKQQGLFDIVAKQIVECNQDLQVQLDIVVCTTGQNHVISQLNLPKSCQFRHVNTQAEGRLLGYECLKVLQQEVDKYDYYCFLEDDLVIRDPWFFRKLRWFNQTFGDGAALMPNRYETTPAGQFRKVYVDVNCSRHWTERYQNIDKNPIIQSTFLGENILFQRYPNPHGPGFYLNKRQFAHWQSKPYYLDYDKSFIGPLESAQTLGIIKTFSVYKSAPNNAAFLELHHVDNRYLGKRIKMQTPEE